MMNLRWKLGGGIAVFVFVGLAGFTSGAAAAASSPFVSASSLPGAGSSSSDVPGSLSSDSDRITSMVATGAVASEARSAAKPTVTISGRPALYQPDKVTARQIPFGSQCGPGNDSFVLANGTAVKQTVTAEGQYVVTLPPHGGSVICGTSSTGSTFTVEFGLAASRLAHLRATFTAAPVHRPDVQIEAPGPQFQPGSVHAPEIAPGTACDSGNYSFLLTNATSSSQTVTIGGQDLVSLPAGQSTVVCGTNSQGAPFTAVMGLEGNPGARLVAHFG